VFAPQSEFTQAQRNTILRLLVRWETPHKVARENRFRLSSGRKPAFPACRRGNLFR